MYAFPQMTELMGHPEISGFFALFKPAGLSSAAALNIAKKTLQVEKAGFLGTLDLPATGVLPIAVGHATKIIPFLPPGDKEYVGELVLGLRTVTDDLAGTIIETQNIGDLSEESVKHAMQVVAAQPRQVPPHVSAKQQHGVRGYKAVRSGRQPLEFQAVPVHVEQLTVLRCEWEDHRYYHVYFRMKVTPGFYVRAFCRDVGRVIGCGGCMGHLLRTSASGFGVRESVSLEVMQRRVQCGDLGFITWGEDRPCLLASFEQIKMDAQAWQFFSHGLSIPWDGPDGKILVVRHPDGRIAGMAEIRGGRAQPVRVFSR